MIEVKNLTKYYGAKRALDDISFKVDAGEILGFLGPNGAGKTTTMNIITGYLSSTQGTVTVDGHEILGQPMQVKSRIGYLPEHPPLYMDMTVEEYLSFMYDLKRLKLDKEAHIAQICERVQIADVYGRLIKNLSKGYRQRVGLAQALLGDPPVLILDEPTVGLDPRQIIDIRNLIRDLGKEHTIILSSHILSEVQATCERIIVIAQGKIVADDTPDNLSRTLSTDHSLVARIAGPRDEVLRALKRLPGAAGAQALGMGEEDAWDYTVEPKEGEDIRRALFAMLAEKNWPLLGLRSNELTLEEIFMQLVSGAAVLDEAEDESALTDAQRAARGRDKKPKGKGAKRKAAAEQDAPKDGDDPDKSAADVDEEPGFGGAKAGQTPVSDAEDIEQSGADAPKHTGNGEEHDEAAEAAADTDKADGKPRKSPGRRGRSSGGRKGGKRS